MLIRAPMKWFPDDRGAVALVAAIGMTMIMALAALAVDAGVLYATKRQLQAATDMAALSATYAFSEGSSATTLANSYIAKNITGAPQVTVTTGIYCPNASLATGARFTANGVSCADNADLNASNAVEVSASISSPLYFGGAILPNMTSETIHASATAAQINEAGFYAGSGLLSVATMNNAILNALLPGSTISLASYQGLVNTNVNALSFLNALATNLNLTAGTFNGVLNSTVTIQQVLQAETTALNTSGSIVGTSADLSQALSELAQLQASIAGSPSIQLSNLFNLGVWQNVPVGSTNSATTLNAGLNVYQLATLAAQLANGTNAVAIPNTSLGIPGVATVSTASTVIEPPQGPAFIFSPVGVTVHTAQVRLQLNLQLLSALSLGGALGTAPVNLPIYVEIGSGNATLSAISCGYNPATDATVAIDAQSGAAQAYVGAVTSSVMSNFSNTVTVQPATLVNIANVVQVTGSAEVSVASGAATPLTFNQTQIAALTAQTVTSTGMLSNLLQTLGNTLVLNGTLLGAKLSGNSTLLTSLTTLLKPAFAGLDTLVDELLAALGIKIGYMDVTTSGVRCGVPTLVN
jgi:uncharacterized membrane protein